MTTSTPPGISRATLSNPADLIASLPYLLGFRPAESLVLLGHRVPGTTIGLMLRADLPPRELQAQQADALIPRFDDHEHNGVTVVIVGGSGDDNGPPHRTFVAELERGLKRHHLRLFHALWTPEIEPGAPWSCYRDPDCSGVLPDPQETVIAAATTEAGFVVFRSREELAAVLEPRCPEAIARRAELLASCPEPLYRPGMSSSDVLNAAVTELRDAFLRQRRGAGPPDDDQAVRLAHALMFTPVRDACLALAVPPHTSLTREAEEVWLTLVRELPPPHRAEAAMHLGYTALMRGEGALAGMALANAVEADPEHLVAQLLQAAWNIGTDPAKLTGLADFSTAADLGLSPPPEPDADEPGPGRRSEPPTEME
ncbi:DUF4192 domain-containing protein [Amycolatopsis sp. AA4]|uniref:DUF4192 domain-containing protein n=1 Tax=Actinomycetes TaxID=1760 RepID=UPI0001B56554|nr:MULTISPECIES: DUF4192 domain-containing protein [Actinomycetes]ATY10738.1 DUF4192 domain-containing protein [Amycolatopsis sp. AA4]EFL06258.1 predicted protein [Streptomyces sp. AA4]